MAVYTTKTFSDYPRQAFRRETCRLAHLRWPWRRTSVREFAAILHEAVVVWEVGLQHGGVDWRMFVACSRTGWLCIGPLCSPPAPPPLCLSYLKWENVTNIISRAKNMIYFPIITLYLYRVFGFVHYSDSSKALLIYFKPNWFPSICRNTNEPSQKIFRVFLDF